MAPAANTQLQRIVVPVPNRPHFQGDPHINLGSVLDLNKVLKTTVSLGLKAIPIVGSLLSGLIKALWPNPRSPGLRWDDIDKNVREIVHSLLDEDKVRDLRRRIDSLHDLIDQYNRTEYGISQKGQRFTYILSHLTVTRREFTENGTPWLTLQFFVPLATLHLGFLREQLLHWGQSFSTKMPTRPVSAGSLTRPSPSTPPQPTKSR